MTDVGILLTSKPNYLICCPMSISASLERNPSTAENQTLRSYQNTYFRLLVAFIQQNPYQFIKLKISVIAQIKRKYLKEQII